MTPQCRRILDLLQDRYEHSGGEIYERTKIIKYSTRISDLREKHGFNIPRPKYRDGQFWYKLFPKVEQKKLFNVPANYNIKG